MAGIRANLLTPADVALVAATAKTVLQITAPANQRLVITRFGVYFDGVVSSNTPVVVELCRQSTAGAGGTTATPTKHCVGTETLQATGLYGITTEPTTGDVIARYRVHPQQGWQEFEPLDGRIEVGGGTRLGIRLTAAQIVNASAQFFYEE
jgi:hypothetical protein